MQSKLPFHFDMETADPDDSMTLAIDPSKALWAEVIPYRTKGEWGCLEAKSYPEQHPSLITTYIPDLTDLWMVIKP
jgi:hypothetical protein